MSDIKGLLYTPLLGYIFCQYKATNMMRNELQSATFSYLKVVFRVPACVECIFKPERSLY